MRMPELPPPPSGRRKARGLVTGRGAQFVEPRLNRENNPGEARWCEEHGRLECVRKARSKPDGVCHQVAIRGVDYCKTHPGWQGKRKAFLMGEAQITAWSAINKRDGGVAPGANLDPGMAVLGMLQMSWLRVAAYGELLRQQVALEEARQYAIEGVVVEVGQEGDEQLKTAGLIGHKMSATNDGSLYATSEEIRALVVLEASERDRCVSYAEKAHKMGISERMTSMAEQWSDVVAGRVVAMLDDLDLTPAQQAKVPFLVQSHLAAIDVSGAPSS